MFAWQQPLPSDGLGGIAAADGIVVVGGRDVLDTQDVFLAFSAADGQPLWHLTYPAPGALDYGNSPRATPVIHEGAVFLQGAFGNLHCVDARTGEVIWNRNLRFEFGSPRLTWGLSGSPLIVDDKLIVQPGGPLASVVALDRKTGEVVWQAAGLPPGYSSFAVASFAGRRQLIGYDARTLGGWDVESGQRLWSLVPPERGDFNVPTPIPIGNRLFVATENNGARLYQFDATGVIDPNPVAVYEGLAPDSHTPVVVGGHVFGIANQMVCLDPSAGLREVWVGEDDAFYNYCSIIGGRRHLLVLSLQCELILVAAETGGMRIVDRLQLTDEGTETHSHPAIDGRKLFVRLGSRLVRLDLDAR